MKMTLKEQIAHRACDSMYVIDYITPYGRGHMEIKKSLYNKVSKKLTKLFSDAIIISFVEEKV